MVVGVVCALHILHAISKQARQRHLVAHALHETENRADNGGFPYWRPHVLLHPVPLLAPVEIARPKRLTMLMQRFWMRLAHVQRLCRWPNALLVVTSLSDCRADVGWSRQ
eukprot:1654680-Prymnesium_polylepis.1